MCMVNASFNLSRARLLTLPELLSPLDRLWFLLVRKKELRHWKPFSAHGPCSLHRALGYPCVPEDNQSQS